MKARCLVWIHPDDCIPPHGLDLGAARDADKVAMLEAAFREHGFDPDMPALVGYPINDKVQLLSGTHRHLAAKRADILLPVTLWLRSDIQTTWGTELWAEVLRDIPVRELLAFEIPFGPSLSPYLPVEL